MAQQEKTLKTVCLRVFSAFSLEKRIYLSALSSTFADNYCFLGSTLPQSLQV